MKFAEVLMPVPIAGTFTYEIPEELASAVKPGCRVIVPFGLRRFYTGIVVSVTHLPPEGFDTKPIAMVLDNGDPIVRYPQLKHWQWLADYYLCSVGDVYRAAVPAGLKLESETFIELNTDYEEDPEYPLNEREAIVIQVLSHFDKRMTMADIEKTAGLKHLARTISTLLQKGAIIISERLVERYRPLQETYVRLNFPNGDMSALAEAFSKVKGARKQETALQNLIQLSAFNRQSEPPKEVSRAALIEHADVTTAIIKALSDKGIVEIYRKTIDRFKYSGIVSPELPQLSEPQSKALSEIHQSWMIHNTTLLHGVTSSGKTEIYIHLIDYALRQGKQVLMLVPEIALTTQLSHRLQKVFGDKVMVYHSKFSDNVRVEHWNTLLHDGSPRVILGARTSVFLPFSNLGLVIVDEEHETSYKQQDPAPRYNARDAAIVLAVMHGAKVLLGSATPSVETYYKATTGGKYGLVTLSERYQGATLPRIEIVDMGDARKKGLAQGALAARSHALVSEAIGRGHQAIVFINRRGFAPVARCRMCANIPRCHNCDVAMTYHRSRGLLVCHYCGATRQLPSVCPACHEPAIEVIGYGSERVEEEVTDAFPQARILRMDLDTTRNKAGYDNIIQDFSSGKGDILIGTQMVSKGLDFGGVDTVVVVNADSIINFPDYRSDERAFNMISQVAGRAGRRSADTPGTVTVQTLNPAHEIFQYIVSHDYKGFYDYAIAERQAYHYPPFTKLIRIYIKHRNLEAVKLLADAYGVQLRQLFGDRVQGPQEPPIGRIQQLYIRCIMLKVETSASMSKVRKLLLDLRNLMHSMYPDMKSAVIYYDVDPM